jgi:hypothetical protein
MTKSKFFFTILLIVTILICGCTVGNPIEKKISDDDLYLQALNDYSIESSLVQESSSQFSREQVAGTKMKIKATAYYNKISELKVSSKFEQSKTSFLQALKKEEAMADYMMTMSEEMKLKNMQNSMSNTIPPNDLAKLSEFQTNTQNYVLFSMNAFDSNLCSAAGDKYPNITKICKSVADMKT